MWTPDRSLQAELFGSNKMDTRCRPPNCMSTPLLLQLAVMGNLLDNADATPAFAEHLGRSQEIHSFIQFVSQHVASVNEVVRVGALENKVRLRALATRFGNASAWGLEPQAESESGC